VTNVRELADKIEADKQLVEDLTGPMAGLKDEIEGLAAQARALGVERAASALEQAKGVLEEAESGRVVLQGGLEKARWQVMSAVHGNLGPGARGSGPGGSFIAADGKVITADGGSAIPHLDAIPPHLRQGPTPTGEELMGVDPSIGPFGKEHESANRDRKMGRLARAARIGVQNAEDLKSGGQALVSGANADADGFDPPPPGGYNTMTQVPDHQPQIHSVPTSQPSVTDVVGSAIVMAVVIAESASRLVERRKRNRNGG
jgi:hypothetical protein